MIIKDIFEKKIDRDIRGVIKVDKGLISTGSGYEITSSILLSIVTGTRLA